ncbi:hypothetical protein COK19_15850 [Bacillus cereus]|uniref:hypothetical protein n=1 Tax=Bacillus cereus TaxID=1396 RepID=UPI000BF98765|nr:hypothetical protein [Bacillus cereus]PFR25356.1 hypothetical protein COK19_15850 [Bacillus cereus]
MNKFIPSDYLSREDLRELNRIRRRTKKAQTVNEVKAYEKMTALILRKALQKYNDTADTPTKVSN